MTDHNISTQMLIREATNAGASGAFVAMLATDTDGRHLARAKVRGALAIEGRTLKDSASTWGHFLTALWAGDIETAWRRADGQNRGLMRKAMLAPRQAVEP